MGLFGHLVSTIFGCRAIFAVLYLLISSYLDLTHSTDRADAQYFYCLYCSLNCLRAGDLRFLDIASKVSWRVLHLGLYCFEESVNASEGYDLECSFHPRSFQILVIRLLQLVHRKPFVYIFLLILFCQSLGA